ncbi:ABC transporter permease [Muricomes intestini]|uniref:ABC transporter permease n=1 Tax=Muricomes intestini TaxID=1796634 RepID=UPI000ECF58A6|nr:hypothetical protein [Lachnospiraceae bacterium]
MNIVNKLTLRHLKTNKGRTIVTILGITVSVAMITAVFVSIASFLDFNGKVTILSGGNSHALFQNITQGQLKVIEKDSRIKSTGITATLQENGFYLEGSSSYRIGSGQVLAGDLQYLRQMVTSGYDGKLPENEHEIAVEEEFIEKNHLKWKPGDRVTLDVGSRFLEQSGEKQLYYGSYLSDEEFTQTGTKDYKITAILHTNIPTQSAQVLRGMSDREKEGNVDAVILLKEVDHKSLDVIKSMVQKYQIQTAEINTDYLETKFAIDENSRVIKAIIPMTGVMLVIIVLASVVLIYNAFGMSLSERVRYLGMLASVGATKRQKRNSVYFEGFLLGLAGIITGIIAGIAGISVTLKIVGRKMIASGMIQGITESEMSMNTVVPIWCIIGIVIVSAFTIFISSVIPARKASAITPIDAIRQQSEWKLKARKLKSPRYIRKIFGYEGELAHKSLKRNSRKTRVITFSITLSVVLFLCVNYFCQMFMQAADISVKIPYQIQVMVDYDEKDKLAKELGNISDIDDFYCVNSEYFEYGEKSLYNMEPGITDKKNLTEAYKDLFQQKVKLYVNNIDDEAFNALCEKNGLDYRDFYSGTIKGLLMNNISHKEGGKKVFTEKVLGEQVYQKETAENSKVEIAGLINYDKENYVCKLSDPGALAVYVPQSYYFKTAYQGVDSGDLRYLFGIETKRHAEVTEKVLALLDEQGYTHTYCSDVVKMFQTMNTVGFVIEVFVYGFVTLITLITIANIINTVSTGIALRKKEFAMLKSVGMTPKGFRKMIRLESLFYGLKALVVGIPLSLLLSYGINRAMGEAALPFEVNWVLYLAVIIVVFLIILMSMQYSVSKLKHDTIVETLKEEIL